MEIDMDLFTLALYAIVALGLGSAFTVLLVWCTPSSFAALSAKHGRFVGLGESTDPTPSRGVPANVRAQQEGMNTVGTTI
jgi:hypothetical protein